MSLKKYCNVGCCVTGNGMRNIELKARLAERSVAESVCQSLEASYQGAIHQIDTYFQTPQGRLKLREASPGETELVYYERPDVAGPKGCDYQLETVSPSIKEMLRRALGVVTVVDKVRQLYLWQNVRIHLDEVRGLGSFIEFEAVLGGAYDEADGFEKLRFLIEAFQIDDDAHEEFSYLELMRSEQGDDVTNRRGGVPISSERERSV